MFVEPSRPRDDFALTYNVLACADNARTFNDGYHVLHHANSRTHWSELPAAFVAALDKHDARDGERRGGGMRVRAAQCATSGSTVPPAVVAGISGCLLVVRVTPPLAPRCHSSPLIGCPASMPPQRWCLRASDFLMLASPCLRGAWTGWRSAWCPAARARRRAAGPSGWS